MRFLFLILLTAISATLFAKNDAVITSGPMLANTDMREASIWFKTQPNAQFDILLENSAHTQKANLEVSGDSNGICKVTFKNLTPSTNYAYAIQAKDGLVSGGFKTRADYKTRTPAPDFTVAVLGRVHRNDPLYDESFKTPGGDYKIFDTVSAQNPQAVIWANNAASFLNADFTSKSGMFERYLYERSDPALKKLLQSAPNYGVIGIESYGQKDSDKRLWNKKDVINTFKSFWINPSFGVGDVQNCATFFKISDTEFFILDDVSARNNFDYADSRLAMLGKEQMQWLLSSLKKSTATFKIVISNSPILNPVENDENFAKYSAERKELLDFLIRNRIGGVLFVCANKSYGEITRLVRAGAHEIFEICAGPATDRVAKNVTEMNFFRVPGSTVLERSFALIKIGGAENDRSLELEFKNADGKTLFTQKLKASDLYRFD